MKKTIPKGSKVKETAHGFCVKTPEKKSKAGKK